MILFSMMLLKDRKQTKTGHKAHTHTAQFKKASAIASAVQEARGSKWSGYENTITP